MRQKLSLVAVAVLSLGLCGCPLILVGAGAMGGYAVGKDSVRNQFEVSKDHLFRQSLAAAKEMGFVTTEDAVHGIIKLKIQDANVTITITPLTQRAVELKVKARNALLLPEVEVAQQVYNAILKRL